MPNASNSAALQVIQEAISLLASWANTPFPPSDYQPPSIELQPFVQAAKDILKWSEHKPSALQIVFDRVCLTHKAHDSSKYRPAWSLEVKENEQTPRIPYLQDQTQTEAEFEILKGKIRNEITQLNLKNLAQLTLFLEKFGSHLSIGESDIALIDQARSTAAIAAALAQNSPDNKLALIGGDLMGVQKFIYTISSEGALKSLRARSFYLELATEEVVQQLLTALNLPRTNVIYAGASKFYLLVAATNDLENTLKEIQTNFNDWLLDTFQRKVFLAIAYEPFSAKQLQVTADSDQTLLAQIWQQVNDKLTAQASRKFEHRLDKILQPQFSHQPCKVCHRDDVPEEKLKPLNKHEADSVLACETCRTMFDLGDRLPEVKALVRSSRRYSDDDIQIQSVFYHPVEHFDWKPNPGEVVFQINNWDLKAHPSNQFVPMLLGNYFQKSSETGGFLSASEMADAVQGIKRVGYLRMDVDRLSQIFSKGLGQAYTLPRLACLSRQMTYFFKVYLNSLAAHRQSNLPENHQALMLDTDHQPHPRPNLLFIYAGGDDLFVSGAWNEIVEFAFDVYQSFRAYTGNHPDITLSGGISLSDAKYPLYQAATDAGDAEHEAKGNGKDSLGMFGEVFKWSEWLGIAETSVLSADDQDYLKPEGKPNLFGVLPFVERLDQQLEVNQSRSFVRNLLITAQVQTQMLQQIKDQKSRDAKDIRYYLHLPKIAYTLARLPSRVRDHPDFDPIRTSLKSPYNAPYFRAIATWIELLNR